MPEVHEETWDTEGRDPSELNATQIFEIVMPRIGYTRALLEGLMARVREHIDRIHDNGVLNKSDGDLLVTTTATAGEYEIAPGSIVVGNMLMVSPDPIIVTAADGDYIYALETEEVGVGPTVPDGAEVVAQISGGSVIDLRTQIFHGSEGVEARGSFSTLHQRFLDIENTLSTATTETDDLDTRLSTAETEIDTLQTETGDIDTRLTTAEGEIDTLQSDLGALQTTVSDLETEVQTARGSFASLNDRLNDIESRISALESA